MRVVNRTPAPIQTPATPPTGSSRNPIEVSSASPKKKRNRIEVGSVSPKKKRDRIKARPASPKKKPADEKISARTRINKSLKRPSPIASTPSASPPRQRRRHHSPQQSGFPSATYEMPASNAAIAPAVNSEPIEISSDSNSSDSNSSNGEVLAPVCGRRGAPSILTAYPRFDASSESEDELPAPAFMFRTLAGASPDDMYDSDSPSEATPLIAVTLAPALQRSPYVPASGSIPRTLAGASPDDMYDLDSPSEATPIAATLAPAAQHSSRSIDAPDEARDTLVHFDPTPLSSQGMQAMTPPNRAIDRHLTPARFPLTQSITHRRFLTPTLLQSPLGYTTPRAVGSAINSPNYSPFAHLSQAELDSLLEDQLDSLK